MEKKPTDAEMLARIRKGLECDTATAQDVLNYDKAIDKGEPTPFDLSPEKNKIARKFAHTGTRKTPTVYKFDKRERKKDITKENLIAGLAEYLQTSVENVNISNPSNMVDFELNGESFSLKLTRHRAKK